MRELPTAMSCAARTCDHAAGYEVEGQCRVIYHIQIDLLHSHSLCSSTRTIIQFVLNSLRATLTTIVQLAYCSLLGDGFVLLVL